MDDLMGKIQEMLSDEDSMKQLGELAQMFSSSGNSEKENSAEEEKKPAQNNTPDSSSGFDMGDFDFTKILKVQEVMSKATNDKSAELLLALRPLLKEEKQVKVDKAVKMLKLFAVWTILKDSGLLSDLF